MLKSKSKCVFQESKFDANEFKKKNELKEERTHKSQNGKKNIKKRP